MATPLWSIKNHQGMQAHSSYAVYSRDTLYALDLIGAEIAVKALAASIYERNRRLLLGGGAYATDAALVCTQKETLYQNPHSYRWHFSVRATPTDPLLLVYGFGRQTPAEALLAVLQQQTPWPARPVWGEPLYQAGQQHELISPLQYHGSVTFAYHVTVAGWDTVLSDLARHGTLSLEE